MIYSAFYFVVLTVLFATCVNASLTLNWTQCAIDAEATYSSAPNSTFLIGIDGTHTEKFTNAWGISYDSCNVLCGPRGADSTFEWLPFLTGVSSWILPWFALMAQLPYETNDAMSDVSALILAMGSPLLISYSLCVTILTSRWITRKFSALRDERHPRSRNWPSGRSDMIDGVGTFLRYSQHVPIAISATNAELAQLLILPENVKWWTALCSETKRTRRDFTASLAFQNVLVIITGIIAIVLFFSTIDQEAIGTLGVAINNLYIWMIPVTLGWVFVGTQLSSKTIADALKRVCTSASFQGVTISEGDIVGFEDCRMERNNTDRSDPEAISLIQRKSPESPALTNILIGSLAGDALSAGPIFNYARLWSHYRTATFLFDAIRNIYSSRNHDYNFSEFYWGPDSARTDDMRQKLKDFNTEVFVHKEKLLSSPVVNKIVICSALLGICVQWGTTGAAFIIAYKTPVEGLGCMSGSFLIYGLNATMVWILLMSSTWMFHCDSIHFSSKTKSRMHLAFEILIPVTRYAGKFLAAINFLWLLAISLLEFTNVFDNCWCASCVLSLGNKGWVILWASNTDVSTIAKPAWIGAVILGISTTIAAGIFFWIGI